MWDFSTAENQVQFKVYLTTLNENKIDEAEMLQEEYTLLQPWLAEWGKKGKSMVFNLRGVNSAKLSGSFVGIPGCISWQLSSHNDSEAEAVTLQDFLKPYIDKANDPSLLYSPI